MPALAGPLESFSPILKRMNRKLIEIAESLNGETAELKAIEVLFPRNGFGGVWRSGQDGLAS